MMKSKMFLLGCLLVSNSITLDVCAAQSQNNFAAVFLNWPAPLAQPQFQMEVSNGTSSQDYYGNIGGGPMAEAFGFIAYTSGASNNHGNTYQSYVFGGTNVQTQGYYSSIVGNSSNQQLFFKRPDTQAKVASPSYVVGIGAVSWADILFTARASTRQWMEGVDWGGNFTPDQLILLQSTLTGLSQSFSNYLFPQYTRFYNWLETAMGYNHMDYTVNTYTSLLWFNGVPFGPGNTVVNASGGPVTFTDPAIVQRTNLSQTEINAFYNQSVFANMYAISLDNLVAQGLPLNTTTTYTFSGYWNYYANPDTAEFTDLYRRVNSLEGVPEYFSEASFLAYLQPIQSYYLHSQQTSAGTYNNNSVIALYAMIDPAKPSFTLSPQSFVTSLPGLASNGSTHEFFLNLLINNSPNTQAELGLAYNGRTSYKPLYVVSGGASTVAGLSDGNIYYLPLLLSDPGVPYVPVAWNYATQVTEFEPLKSLQSDFVDQLGAIKSLAPVGA